MCHVCVKLRGFRIYRQQSRVIFNLVVSIWSSVCLLSPVSWSEEAGVVDSLSSINPLVHPCHLQGVDLKIAAFAHQCISTYGMGDT